MWCLLQSLDKTALPLLREQCFRLTQGNPQNLALRVVTSLNLDELIF